MAHELEVTQGTSQAREATRQAIADLRRRNQTSTQRAKNESLHLQQKQERQREAAQRQKEAAHASVLSGKFLGRSEAKRVALERSPRSLRIRAPSGCGRSNAGARSPDRFAAYGSGTRSRGGRPPQPSDSSLEAVRV